MRGSREWAQQGNLLEPPEGVKQAKRDTIRLLSP